MSDKIQITFRMKEESREKLKIISAFQRRPMGDILDFIIEEHYQNELRRQKYKQEKRERDAKANRR